MLLAVLRGRQTCFLFENAIKIGQGGKAAIGVYADDGIGGGGQKKLGMVDLQRSKKINVFFACYYCKWYSNELSVYG